VQGFGLMIFKTILKTILKINYKMMTYTEYKRISGSKHWSRKIHSTTGRHANNILSTFLLGIQRLEEDKIIPLAHQAMFEDMFELLTLNDLFYYDIMPMINKLPIIGTDVDARIYVEPFQMYFVVEASVV
jgi:hypothetical protein